MKNQKQTKPTKISSKTAPGKIQSPKKIPSKTTSNKINNNKDNKNNNKICPPTKKSEKDKNDKKEDKKEKKPEKKEKVKDYSTKEKGQDIDTRAFVSGQAPTKIEEVKIEKKTNMNCVKTVKLEDDLEKMILINNCILVACLHNGNIKLYDTSKDTDKPLNTLIGHTEAVKDIIQMGNNTIITVSIDTTIRKFSITTGKELTCYKAEQPVYCIKKIDDSFIAIGGADKKVKILDFPQNRLGEEIKDENGEVPNIESIVFEGHVEGITCLELYGKNTLISGSMDKTIKIWDIEKKCNIDTLFGHSDCVRCLKLLTNSNLLASGGDDTLIFLWDPIKFSQKSVLKGQAGHVLALAELLDGRLASAGSDWSVIVWDIEKGTSDFILEGHEEAVCSLLVLGDGRIVTGGNDQCLKIWN